MQSGSFRINACLKRILSPMSKDTSEASYLAISSLWRLCARTGNSCHVLPIFKIIIIFGTSVTMLLYYLSLDWTIFVEDQSYGIAAIQDQQIRYVIESRPCPNMKRDCYTVYDAVDMFTWLKLIQLK
uniref:Uncharacterized protein n=1 Tax=Wuchereria bancrofti TaxID=6293 RepID=A0A1I8EZK3_WUCBA